MTEALDYTYDAGWRQSSACTSRGGCYVNSGATYTALDQSKRWVQGNNVVSRWTYTTYLQRLQQLQIGTSSCAGSGCLFDRSYGYDNAGNVLSITDNKSAGNNQTYDYDHRDRLTSWTLSGSTQSYSYNQIGNLTNKAGHAYTYGNTLHKHAVTNDGVNSYGYDANGNQTTVNGVTRYTWNAENFPTSIIGSDGIAETYGYDGDNERVKKVRSGATTIYLEGLWEETVGGATKIYYPFNGQPVAVRDTAGNGSLTYLHGDHLGSVSLATNISGTPASQQEFDPWGVVRSGGIGQTSLNFTGQRLDGTGLLYYHARYYDPRLGRFLSPDALVPNPSNPQDFNRYSYVNNNPLRYTDPTGHCTSGLGLDTALCVASGPAGWVLIAALIVGCVYVFCPGAEQRRADAVNFVDTLIGDLGQQQATQSVAGEPASPPQPTPPPGSELFRNTRSGDLDGELATAQRLGVRPIRGAGSDFDKAINEGTVKWAVTAEGDLVVVPKYVQGEEIAHSVLTGGRPVLAAGEAEIAGSGGQYVGLEINYHTGHYLVSKESLRIGIDAFARMGINFPGL